MTEVLSSHIPSSPSSLSCASHNDGAGAHQNHPQALFSPTPSSPSPSIEEEEQQQEEEEEQLSLLALLVTVFRKSLVACRAGREDLRPMEIGWPTDVQHVAHVTFDRFHGFLGLPVEFEPEVPRRAPSASANVFGVSTESMQCSYDSRGNSVPTILLLMQRCLYLQGGLQAEGIFRINAENSQEEYVRDQLNRGTVPDGIDVHCLAGLIKAWFRELPSGVLDSLTPEQEEQHNKMNAHNVATVFAPNMTQMADPLTALMYAVQVMNFLKTLIIKTLREREDAAVNAASANHSEPSDENGRQSPSQLLRTVCSEEGVDHAYVADTLLLSDSQAHLTEENSTAYNVVDRFITSTKKAILGEENGTDDCSCEVLTENVMESAVNALKTGVIMNAQKSNNGGQSSNSNLRRGSRKVNGQYIVRATVSTNEKSRGPSIVSRINSRTERVEAWR
ncbi:hypothetical protein MRB53_016574 [Persea americana]|uniref:Uncharacterized protein n=1 Tax=Persea americana TaxID=3435 RepID=A0ACC2M2J3_PERAE|nr:hypothetical protein MRB53_016574 [Persea americana]